MSKPFAGVRILDFTRYLAGPYGTYQLALRTLESAPAARTTVQSPLRWAEDAAWKLDYNNLDKLTPEEIAEKRKEFDAVKAVIATKPDRT